MPTEIEAYSLTREVKTKLVVQNKVLFQSGGWEDKYALEATVGTRGISLVERDYDQTYVDNWKVFRAAGLPVVPTLRKSSEGKLLVTDVKADGSEVYGKGVYQWLHHRARREKARARPEIDITHFFDVTHPDNFGKIEQEAEKYIDLANKNKIGLPYDDPFELVIHPDGTSDLMILDLNAGFHPGSDNHEKSILQDYERINNQFVPIFLENLKETRVLINKVKKNREEYGSRYEEYVYFS